MMVISLICVTLAVLAALMGFASSSAAPMWVAGVLFVISAGFLLMSWPSVRRPEHQPPVEEQPDPRRS